MKNDVVASLAWLALAWALWDVGRRATAGAVARVVVLAAVPITVKYSGLLAGVLVPVVLLARAVAAESWPVLGRSVVTRSRRLAVAGGITLAAAAFTVLAVWAVYGFRFRSGPAVTDRLDIPQLVDRAVDNEVKIHPGQVGPGMAVRAAVFADEHHLLPEPFVGGFLFTYGQSLVRPAYLLGETSLTGWWYYFPVVMLMKTPTATLAAALAVALVAVANRRRGGTGGRWAAVALAAPVVVYMASALSTHLNIGLRHVLPVYPPLFVAAGWATAAAVRRWTRGAVVVAGVLFIGLTTETAVAWPHFIPFANAPTLVAVDGDRLELFADSNMDWGQDLPLLAAWRRDHRTDPLYLSYFGLADPRAYGIDYIAMPGGYGYDAPPLRMPEAGRPCWVAVSASLLQSTLYAGPGLDRYYRHLSRQRPFTILGHSIYLFRLDPLDQMRTGTGRW